jgi:hypothetical protein
MENRTVNSDNFIFSMEEYERFNRSALHILENGNHSFKSFVFAFLDNEGEGVLQYLKSLYLGIYYLPNVEYHKQFMDSAQKIDSYKLDDLFEEWKNNFRFGDEDFYASEIARSVVTKLLKMKNIVPKDIVAIGHYLFALERLPVKTDGIDAHIEISYQSGDENFHETKTYAFRLNEEFFHIDVSGSQYNNSVGSDSICYPSWYIERTGGRDCECKLEYLENEIEELLALGAKVTTEDYSTLEDLNDDEQEGKIAIQQSLKLPIGMLIYWAHRFEEDHAIISGMWYYKDTFVPSNVEEKRQSTKDLKVKRCTALNIEGTFDQILDLLMQSDRFITGGKSEINQFVKLKEELINSPENKSYIFDDIYNLQGTSLMIDTVVEVDETMEDIQSQLKTGKAIYVNISKTWSFTNEIIGALNRYTP